MQSSRGASKHALAKEDLLSYRLQASYIWMLFGKHQNLGLLSIHVDKESEPCLGYKDTPNLVQSPSSVEDPDVILH